MPNTGTNEQDQHALKAEERRRRVSSMMTTTGNGTRSTESEKVRDVSSMPSVHGTAVAVKHHDGSSSTPRRTKEGQLALVSEKAAASAPAAAATSAASRTTPPTSLTDMEIKASARQGHVSRLLSATTTTTSPTTTTTTSTTTTTPTTEAPNQLLSNLERDVQAKTRAPVAHGALSDLETKALARQGHVTRLLEPLQTQEDRVRQKLQVAQAQVTRSNNNKDDDEEEDGKPAARRTDAVRQHGPTDIPHPDALLPPPPYHSAHHTLPTSTTTKNDEDTMSQNSDTVYEIRAEIVDEQQDRAKIVQEAHADLLAKAVVASSVKTDEGKLLSKKTLGCWMCAAVGLLAVVGAIVGGVCGGAGLCAGPAAVDRVQRANSIAALINGVTLRETPIAMLSDGRSSSASASASTVDVLPEEEALLFLIEDDALQLQPDKDSERLIQRYALAVLWFTNGPWSDTLAVDGFDVVGGDPTRNWFVGKDECLWTGVTCVDGEVLEISLVAKDMVGALPADLTLLTGLTSLIFNQNKLTGPIPSFLTKFTALERFVAQNNVFTGPGIPTFLSELTSLKEYSVEGNELTGEIPDSLATMTQLEVFRVGSNELVGTLPEYFTEFPSLRRLNTAFNDLMGTVPSGLFQLTDLEELTIGGSSITGSYDFADLQGLSKLTSLNLSRLNLGSALEDDMVEWWPKMEMLNLINCGLGGTLPESFAAWDKLHLIDVSNNDLTGTLPPTALAAWTNMDYFSVGFNDFRGTIPTEIGLWTAIDSFDIRHNMFTGTLPTEIGVMSNLFQFLVTDNQLTGVIPDEVLNFNEAYTWLDLNNFSGVAPYCDGSRAVVDHRVDCDSVACDCCSGC